MNEILTPCIVHNIIICSTIIILCVVAVSAFRIYKVEERKKKLEMKDIENGSCLGSYIFLSSIVVLIAVLIFSYAFFANKDVLDFMSLASALISIILAVITIIYSFVVNGQSTKQVDKLISASESLQETADKAIQASNEMNETAHKVDEVSKLYAASARKLDNNIDIILEKIGKVADAIVSVDEYELKTDSDSKKISSDKTIDEFCSNCPNAGLMIIYACMKAEKSKRILHLKRVFDPEMIMYYVGFLASLQSLGYVEADMNFEKLTLKNIMIHNDFKEIIPKLIMSRKDNKFVKDIYEKLNQMYPKAK